MCLRSTFGHQRPEAVALPDVKVKDCREISNEKMEIPSDRDQLSTEYPN